MIVRKYLLCVEEYDLDSNISSREKSSDIKNIFVCITSKDVNLKM